MNWLKKGPELKMPKLKKPSLKRNGGGGGGSKGPSIKPPTFVADLYYDLRDRRLLPVIALVLVAIVAVPFLLGGDSEDPALPAEVGAATGSDTAKASQLTVVEATPGLRDYRKRLSGRSETDPFEQQYTESAGGSSSEAGSGSASSSSGEGSSGSVSLEVDESESDEVVETAPSPGADGGSSGGTDPGTSGRFYAYRPNVRFGVAGSEDLTVHEHLPLGKLLPQENAILVFIGASENGNQVAFNLTREVTSVRGPGRCVGGKEDCSLLILRAGQAVDLVTEAGQTFRLQVVQIDFVEVERGPKPAGSSSAKHRNAFDRLVVGQFQNPPKPR
jgi:hypothetical protein